MVAAHTNLWLQIAAILTLPFDVVKTRRQIQLGEMDSPGGLGAPHHICRLIYLERTQELSEMPPVYFRCAASLKRASSTWHIMKEIWAELGYRGLFTGRAQTHLQWLLGCLLPHRWLLPQASCPE